MNKEKENRPIIIKRVSNVQHDSHGGAWKVAYADFVTALMAFFLLLWLLNSTPSQKLQGIAQYFEPTIGLLKKSGSNKDGSVQNSDSKDVDSEGSTVKGVVYGVKQVGEVVSVAKSQAQLEQEAMENDSFVTLEASLKSEVEQDVQLSKYKDNIMFDQTPEGLRITIHDQNNRPMFEYGSAKLEPYTMAILAKIVRLIQYLPNFIEISGHTDKNSDTIVGDYTNWELSSDRANSARRFIVNKGIPQERIAKIVSYADTEPVDDDPYSPSNRRISITLLRNSIMPLYKISAPHTLTTPKN